VAHLDLSRASGSELVQKDIGEGSRMVKVLFVMACKAPTIIFIDEIDSISSFRQEGTAVMTKQ
jgi:26S proteasome regulatory subunit T6